MSLPVNLLYFSSQCKTPIFQSRKNNIYMAVYTTVGGAANKLPLRPTLSVLVLVFKSPPTMWWWRLITVYPRV